eukprot:gene4314-4887_t
MKLTLSGEKRSKLIHKLETFKGMDNRTLRDITSLIGSLISTFPAIPNGPLHYRNPEGFKTHQLKISRENLDARLPLLPLAAISEILWWGHNIEFASRNIEVPPADCTITTDARKLGWGATEGKIPTGGRWKFSENEHINYLELKAAYFALKAYCTDNTYQHVRIRIDNCTAISYINNKGGIKSIKCDALAKEIWDFCDNRKLLVSAAFIPGKDNTTADQLSRNFSDQTEWMLRQRIFQQIIERFKFLPRHDWSSIVTNNKGQSHWDHDYPRLENTTLVPNDVKLADTEINSSPKVKIVNHTAVQSGVQTPTTAENMVTGSSLIGQYFTNTEYSAEVKEIIMDSWRGSTKSKYNSILNRWQIFCSQWKENSLRPTINSVLEFLLQLHKGGCLYSGLSAARSALASIIVIPGYSSLSEHPMIARFLKGIFNRHPPLPKYVHIWDINKVLGFYKTLPDNEQLSLKEITQKLVMLLLILGARRKQTLLSILIDNIKITDNGMTLIPHRESQLDL